MLQWGQLDATATWEPSCAESGRWKSFRMPALAGILVLLWGVAMNSHDVATDHASDRAVQALRNRAARAVRRCRRSALGGVHLRGGKAGGGRTHLPCRRG